MVLMLRRRNRVAMLAPLNLRISAMLQEQFHGIQAPMCRRALQRCIVFPSAGVYVGATGDQQLERLYGWAHTAGRMERIAVLSSPLIRV
jgi:hypothetical protein